MCAQPIPFSKLANSVKFVKAFDAKGKSMPWMHRGSKHGHTPAAISTPYALFFYRSFGFVQFDNPASAQAAIRGAQGTMIGGLSIDVTLADNR